MFKELWPSKLFHFLDYIQKFWTYPRSLSWILSLYRYKAYQCKSSGRRYYEYNKKYFTKRTKEPEAVEMVEEVEILGEVEGIQEMAVASAIALLKSKGYIIAKPVVSSLTIL